MLYTLAMRDDVEGGVCVVPLEDGVEVENGVLACPAASAVAVADRLTTTGTWAPHPTMRVGGRPVAVAACAATADVVRTVNAGTPVDAALADATRPAAMAVA